MTCSHVPYNFLTFMAVYCHKCEKIVRNMRKMKKYNMIRNRLIEKDLFLYNESSVPTCKLLNLRLVHG